VTITTTAQPAEALHLFLSELSHTVAVVSEQSDGALADVAARAKNANRVFLVGAGRSGLALRMTAMRLMHLGLDVHVVGDVTTPAIAEGDILIAASGSGTTGGIVRAAETARKAGADVVALSTTDASPLSELASVTVLVPAAAKQDHGGSASQQYSGGLFEHTLVLVGDALFHTLWKGLGESADTLWTRHANLE